MLFRVPATASYAYSVPVYIPQLFVVVEEEFDV
jgi:hypothetical protein